MDHFKEYNDRFGHPAGDVVLRAIAEAIASAAWRPYDLAARYGGEVFALILPNLGSPLCALERIRLNVEALRIPHPNSKVHPM